MSALYYEDMADSISKSDIQHAVQSALHNLRNDVTRVSHIVDVLPRMAQDINDLSRRVAKLEKDINQIQNTVANTLGRPTTRRYPDPYIVGIATEVNQLKLRFTSVERFAAQMSDYVQKRSAQDEEDRQYRTA